MSTIFTKIIKKEITSYLLYEDDLVIVFLDITQATKGHTLVATKKEYCDIKEVPEQVFVHLFKIVHQFSQVLINTFKAKGINLLNNNGKVAGQTVFHYHVHLIPRFQENEINITFANRTPLVYRDYEKIQKDILVNLNTDQ